MKRCIAFYVAAISAAMLLLCPAVNAQDSKKVVLVPFKLFADKDLTYLQKGIGQMLVSRLSQQDKVEVIQVKPAAAKGKTPQDVAKSMDADYVITGSLTLLGNSVSTDAKVLDLKQNKQVLSFNRTGKDQGVIIEHVDQLAAEISTRLLEPSATAVTPQTPAPVANAPAAGLPTADAAADQTPSVYLHPEKLISQPDSAGTAYEGAAGEAATGLVSASSLMMRGRRVEFQMRGISAADVDGDGQKDIVCIGPSNIIVYRVDQKKMIKIAEADGRGDYVGVDAVDVNGNGKAEIFITNFDSSSRRVQSLVMEWDGTQLVRLADRLNWFFRAIEVPNRGRILAGQRQGMDDLFASSIHEMAWKNSVLSPADRLPLPQNLQIYGFAYGAVRAPQDIEVVAYNPGGFVQILGRQGKEKWITSERYGGSPIFLEFQNKTDADQREFINLPPRLHLHDLDEDGVKEIFVVKNENSAGPLKRLRIFKNGRLEGLKWDELGAQSQWRTRSLTKYMADFTIIDMDSDGKSEVVAAVVQKNGSLLSKGRSFLAVFKLDKPSVKKEP